MKIELATPLSETLSDQYPDSVFTDGGVLLRNPSVHGGTFAFCYVNRDGVRFAWASGLVLPSHLGLPTVTNNATELIAAIVALEHLPEGWAGKVFTDSECTRIRITGGKKFNGIPPWLVMRLTKARASLGDYRVTLLGGHPTKKDLAAGWRKDGLPCSIHNVFCDSLCRSEAEKWALSRQASVREPIGEQNESGRCTPILDEVPLG